ncbi:phage antirepressor N-terminal domain-containing protein [Geofilum rubicundum]|uniref:Putative antirepressor protein of cryptic prophage CP-933M n=1 Tax=Geofilum rubicundum JCM 15548 TaxID=1236989 RepID=A0A0E9M1X6_9BACT|nr:phage antirepressor N-terminal domain-containing protein [Geofilum rubicundum]GAO31371.1 putative antirepressor protein of cryptic prophage CP-933M [Geofilum rubicundum JCM 15548]
MKEKVKAVAQINDVSIMLIDGAEKLVPIKPICEALDINHSNQIVKVQKDEILGSVGVLSTSTGNDGKQYEMFCLPYMYALGWLFTVNPKNVKPEARETILKYKMECYTALFNHFSDHSQFLEQKQVALENQLEAVERVNIDFSKTKQELNDARKTLNKVKEMTFDEWLLNKRQLTIDFQN